VPDDINKEIHEKILAAAEASFAQHGYDGASLRQITQAANVNLAAVNYHFGDKQSLYCEVITRRFRPINEGRLARLRDAEQVAGGAPVPLAVIIDLLVRPVFELGQDTVNGGHHTIRIIGRSLTEPQPFMEELLSKEFQPVMARFGQAVRRLCLTSLQRIFSGGSVLLSVRCTTRLRPCTA
jgi:AcrR family transcriptional regulator